MRIQEVKIYTFEELSEEAQAKAIEWYLSDDVGFDSWDHVYDDADAIGKILGIEIDQRTGKNGKGETIQTGPNIQFSGFWSQGDGASYAGFYSYAKGSRKAIRDYAPEDTRLHRIADELARLQKPYFYGLTASITQDGRYFHTSASVDHETVEVPERVADDLEELLQDFAHWIYRTLKKEYEYQTSEAVVRENIIANEYEFTEDGEIA